MTSNVILNNKQKGLSLIELMVAITIGLVLLSGVIQIFASTKQTYRVHEGLSRVQENGRFAMEFLTRDIRMAGFWGCNQSVDNVTNNLAPDVDSDGDGTNDSYSDTNNDFSNGIIGSENNGINNSDTVTIRGAFGSGITVESPFGPQASANINVNAGNGLAQNNIVIISDCSQADVFQITNANPGTSGSVVHNTGNVSEGPGNSNANNPGCPGGGNAHCLSKVYADDAMIFRARTLTYTIQNGASGQPALFRNGNELVSGINSMQILYGEDTNNSGTADYYVTADNITDMEGVVSVQVSLLVQSNENNLATTPQSITYNGTTANAADNRLYQVFTSTITLRNRVS